MSTYTCTANRLTELNRAELKGKLNRMYNRDERVRTFPCVVKPCFLKKELREKSQR